MYILPIKTGSNALSFIALHELNGFFSYQGTEQQGIRKAHVRVLSNYLKVKGLFHSDNLR